MMNIEPNMLKMYYKPRVTIIPRWKHRTKKAKSNFMSNRKYN